MNAAARPYEFWLGEGQRLLAADDNEGARTAFERATTVADSPFERALAEGQQAIAGRETDVAVAAFQRAVDAEPTSADARYMLGMALFRGGDALTGATELQRAVDLYPAHWIARNSLGNALKALDRIQEALRQYREAARLAPAAPMVRRNLGLLLLQLGDADGAAEQLVQGVRLAPADPFAHTYLGMALAAKGWNDEAEAAYRTALQHAPELPIAMLQLGELLRIRGDMAGALDLYETARRYAPEDAPLAVLEAYVRRTLVDWRDQDRRDGELLGLIERAAQAVDPFLMLPITDSPAVLRQIAEKHASYYALGALAPDPLVEAARDSRPARAPDGRLRVGYASSDFGEHATTSLIAQVLELHDRSRFAVHVYSWSDMVDSAGHARVRSAAEVFRDVRENSPAQIAARMVADGIDVAIDLKGYTLRCRPGIFAHRAAPVQVSWLGYPGTTGAPYMDYVIADARIVPPGDERHFSEQVVRLPDSYQPNDRTRTMHAPRSRAEYGLPEQGVVFCSFNQAYKINPTTFDAWCRLLRHVDGSVLWLLEMLPEQAANLRREAADRGVDPLRLVFAPFASSAEHLARYAVADLALDTFPTGSHTTGADALWGGCPLIALRGDSFASRVSSSLLHAARLPELVTSNVEDYERLATELARDPARLRSIRAKVAAAARDPAPLFDPARFCRHLEAAYATMHERQVAGLPSSSFDVKPLS